MAIIKSKKTNSSKLKRIGRWLSPTSPGKKMLAFVIVFAVMGAGFMTYKSFAASFPISHYCSTSSNHQFYGNISPDQNYSIVYRSTSFVKDKTNPAYAAAYGKANAQGNYSTGVYVLGSSSGYFTLYTQWGSSYYSQNTVTGWACSGGAG